MNFRSKFDFESEDEYNALKADFEIEMANIDRQKKEIADQQKPKANREDAAYLRQLEQQEAVTRESLRGLYARVVGKIGIQFQVEHEFRKYPIPCPSPSKSGTLPLWQTRFMVVGSEDDYCMILSPNPAADYTGPLYLKPAPIVEIGVEGVLYFVGDSGIPRVDVPDNYVFVIGYTPDKKK